MTSYIIIIAPDDDLHARVVLKQLAALGEPDLRPLLLDISTFPIGSTLSLFTNFPASSTLSVVQGLPNLFGNIAATTLKTRAKEAISLDVQSVRSIWLRRLRHPVIAPEIEADRFRRFASENTMDVIRGWLTEASDRIPVINVPYAERRAVLKPYQLRVAMRCGLKVPETCISSDPMTIQSFVEKQSTAGVQVIYKPVATTFDAAQGTQLFTEECFQHLEKVCYCPSIFQSRIIGADIRAVVVGSRVFAIKEVAATEEGRVDIRTEAEPAISPIELPNELQERLLRMQQELGLVFGAYDLKLDARGDFWFLEVNPSGQWLWVEIGGGHPISESLARILAYGLGAEREVRQAGLTREEIQTLEPESRVDAYRRAFL